MPEPKKILFQPNIISDQSDTFVIGYGRQITAIAFGLQAGDEITFQAVHVPAIDPDTCACIPHNVELPSVAAHFPLMCCGKEVKLTKDHPYVILDAPQRTLLRAIRNVADPDIVVAWVVETDTPDLNDRLRGCPCE